MGAHFSPCGRFLAACVACMLPHLEGDPGLQGLANHDVTGAATSPTRHPISAHHVVYELRIYIPLKRQRKALAPYNYVILFFLPRSA